MANMNCTDKQNSIKDGRCCDRCPAGKFVKEDCNATNTTKCSDCPQGSFTDELNYLKQCIHCQTCINNSLKERHCTTKTNTVCKCKEGFYCSEAKCDHCEPWTLCPVGEGVKIQPTPTTNTVCAPCGNGTYSNITDYSSSCKPHFRCEDYGLQLKTPGTSTTDAICQNYCSWILPAGLWAGLVLTVVVLAAFIFWRRKRRSYRAGRTSVPVTVVEIVPKPLIPPPELPSHCQESCKLPFCPSDDTQIIRSIEDSLGSSLPITPLKVSVSFAECNHTNDSSGYCTSKFFRSYSEPQEDEWCGT